MKSLAAGIVCVGLGFGSVAASGQQGMGANASVSDAMALLRSAPIGRSPGEPFTLLDKVPDLFPKELIPEGATIGAIAASASTTVVVSAVKAGLPFDQFHFRWKLEDVGWTSLTPGGQGFVMANAYGGAGRAPVTYCRGSDFVTWIHVTSANGDNLVRASVGKEPQRSCAPLGMASFSDVPIPPLELPVGVRFNGSSGGGGFEYTESHARLNTTMSAAALAAPVVAQLKAAGWRVESGPSDDGVMSVTRLTVASKAGDPVTGQLIFTVFEGTGTVDALFRAVRNKPVIRH